MTSRRQSRIREVGPRDGFQNEPEVIATDDKVRLIDALARTGLRRLEVTIFVRADVIPQLADARRGAARASTCPTSVDATRADPQRARARRRAGAARALRGDQRASCRRRETHNRANVNRTIEESLSGPGARDRPRAPRQGLRVEGVISVALRLPLRGARRRPSACSRSPSGWSPRAHRRSASATRPGWPTRCRSGAFFERAARRAARASS